MIYLAVIYVLTLVFFGGLLKSLLDERGRAEAAWQKERADLLQRIQAPQAAVIQHHYQPQGEQVTAVNEFDDDDYWAKVNDLSKDELAELMGEREVTGG